MANKPLQTIKFPGLTDTYTVPQVDSNFVGTAGQVPDSKKVKDEISAVKEDLTAEISRTYTEPYAPAFSVITGGISTSGTDYNNHPERARTQYIDIEAGKSYYVQLNTTEYNIQRAWVYTTKTGAGAVRSLSLIDSQHFVFTADENVTAFRIAFYNANDSTAEITEENRATIQTALKLYTASIENVKVDLSAVKNKADQLMDLVINQPFHEKMQFTVGGIATSTGKTANFTNRMRSLYRRVTPNSTYRVEILNSSYHLYYVHFYSESAETSWLGSPLVIQDNHAVFTAPEGAYYFRIMFYDSSDMGKTMTDADVEALASAFNMYQVWRGSPKKERHGEFIRFTVKNNHRWTDNDSTSTDDAESGTETDHLCILTLPTTYSASGKKTPLIMYCHGASCGITDTTWYGNSTGEGDGANFLAMIRRFTAEGYAIFDVDNTRHVTSGFNDWGSLPLMSAYIKAWEYIKENYNVESDLYLLSASMGTPVALNMMKWYKGRIKTAMILAPRPFGVKGRWDDTYGVITDARKKEFLVAWGFEDDAILTDDTFVVPTKEEVFTAAVDAKYKGFYHYENMVTVDGTKYIFEKIPPTKVMVGTSDTGFLAEVREYFSALQNFGNYINYREVAGKSHGAMCTLVGGNLLDEGVAWFARFREVIT